MQEQRRCFDGVMASAIGLEEVLTSTASCRLALLAVVSGLAKPSTHLRPSPIVLIHIRSRLRILNSLGALVQSSADVVGCVGAALPFVACHHGAGRGNSGYHGNADPFPQPHLANLSVCPALDPVADSACPRPST